MLLLSDIQARISLLEEEITTLRKEWEETQNDEIADVHDRKVDSHTLLRSLEDSFPQIEGTSPQEMPVHSSPNFTFVEVLPETLEEFISPSVPSIAKVTRHVDGKTFTFPWSPAEAVSVRVATMMSSSREVGMDMFLSIKTKELEEESSSSPSF